MKKTKITYWIVTGLMCALMFFSSISSFLNPQASIDLITTHLGYPQYFITYIGIAKILGVIAVLVPGFPRVKEWAYAGLVFDMSSAIYSCAAIGDPISQWFPMFIFLGLIIASYILYTKKTKEEYLGSLKTANG